MEPAQTTRAAIAGVSMAFFSLVLIILGRSMFGWIGAVAAVVVVVVVARGLQPAIVRWIRGVSR